MGAKQSRRNLQAPSLLAFLFVTSGFLFLLGILGGCTDEGSQEEQGTPGVENPFLELPVHRELRFPNLRHRGDVIIDRHGIPHIYAENETDGYFLQGYLMADQRLFQMDAFRRISEGTLSELVGEIPLVGPLVARYVASEIDLYYRTILTSPRGTPVSQEILDGLPPDVVALLQAFCDGINAYVEDLAAGRNGARTPTQWLNPLFPVRPEWVYPFSPKSIISFLLLILWLLSGAMDQELEFAEILEALGPDTFEKVMRVAPADPTITLPDFMDRYWDSSYAPAAARKKKRLSNALLGMLNDVPESLFSDTLLRIRNAQSIFPLGRATGHSNNWVVSGRMTHSGSPIFCGDPHLPMLSPSMKFLTHLDTKTFGSGQIHVAGGTYPPGPVVMTGHNDRVAWAATAMWYDATDVYVETVVPGTFGQPDSVRFKDQLVPIKRVMETFRLGMGPNSPFVNLPIEIVPHHGPILPGSRTDNRALSVKWTAQEPRDDTLCLLFLQRAQDLDEVFEAMRYLQGGSAGFAFADVAGEIGFSGHSLVPVRENQDVWPPYLPMPGTGEAEWREDDWIPEEKLPWDREPVRGFITSSNNDVIGTTLDNDPLNDEYYLYYTRKLGFRARRIEDRIREAQEEAGAGGKLTLEQMMGIQADNISLAGARFTPHIIEAAGRHRDWLVETPAMTEALARLEEWDYTTPTGLDAHPPFPPTADEQENRMSIACSIFHSWLNRFIQNSLSDEFGAQPLVGSHGEDGPQFEVKALLQALEDPGAASLFDNIQTPDVTEDADTIILQSLAEAVELLGRIFNTLEMPPEDAMEQWQWGKIHTATFAFGMGDLMLPDFLSPVLGPFPNDGANFTVDVGNQQGVEDKFHQTHCPNMRLVTEVSPPDFTTYVIIPGGQSGIREDPHFDDMMPLWLRNDYVELAFAPERVIENMERHLVFLPSQ